MSSTRVPPGLPPPGHSRPWGQLAGVRVLLGNLQPNSAELDVVRPDGSGRHDRVEQGVFERRDLRKARTDAACQTATIWASDGLRKDDLLHRSSTDSSPVPRDGQCFGSLPGSRGMLAGSEERREQGKTQRPGQESRPQHPRPRQFTRTGWLRAAPPAQGRVRGTVCVLGRQNRVRDLSFANAYRGDTNPRVSEEYAGPRLRFGFVSSLTLRVGVHEKNGPSYGCPSPTLSRSGRGAPSCE